MSNPLLDKIDMAELLIQMGFSDVNPRAQKYLGYCLFHQDTLTKSFSADFGKKVYFCFGCSIKGNAIDLFARWRNITYQQACQELETLPNFRSLNALDMKLATEKEMPAYRKLEIMTTLIERCRPIGANGLLDDAYNYMLGRGISHQTLSDFGIRIAPTPADWIGLISSGMPVADLEYLGIDYDQFMRYPILFPYWFCGRVTWIQGRCMGEPPSKKQSKYNNVSIGLTYAYNHDVLLTETDTVYICEGAMDVLSMYELGHRSVIGLPGVNNFHANWLQDFRCKKVVLALDNDRAGQEGALKLSKLFLERGIIVERFPLAAEFKDVNCYLQQAKLLDRAGYRVVLGK